MWQQKSAEQEKIELEKKGYKFNEGGEIIFDPKVGNVIPESQLLDQEFEDDLDEEEKRIIEEEEAIHEEIVENKINKYNKKDKKKKRGRPRKED